MTKTSRLARWRDAAGLSQKGLAEKVGVTQSTLAHWERGKSRPRLDLAVLLEGLTRGGVAIESWGYGRDVAEAIRGGARASPASEPPTT